MTISSNSHVVSPEIPRGIYTHTRDGSCSDPRELRVAMTKRKKSRQEISKVPNQIKKVC
jgi:hypothetical protein